MNDPEVHGDPEPAATGILGDEQSTDEFGREKSTDILGEEQSTDELGPEVGGTDIMR